MVFMNFTNYDLKIFSAFCLVTTESTSTNQVTISRIAKKLDVTRQAIYKSHYSNIDEIINALHLYIEEDIQKSFQYQIQKDGKMFDWIHFIANDILPKLYQKREYLNVLYGTTVDTTWHDFLTKKYTTLLNQSLVATKKDFAIEYNEYIVAEALAIIGVWMKYPEPEHPIYFGKRFIFLMEHSISNIININ